MDRHPFDQWDEQADKSQKEWNEKILRDTSLVFQVFSTPAGEQLISRWKEVLMWSPTAQAGDDQLSIGMNEGYKNFIRTLLYSIQQHEEK